jgi:hypothetical protein
MVVVQYLTHECQEMLLGWVVIGETCLDNQHATPDLSVKKTFILPTGQPTTLTPCENKFSVRQSNPASLEYQEMFPFDGVLLQTTFEKFSSSLSLLFVVWQPLTWCPKR